MGAFFFWGETILLFEYICLSIPAIIKKIAKSINKILEVKYFRTE